MAPRNVLYQRCFRTASAMAVFSLMPETEGHFFEDDNIIVFTYGDCTALESGKALPAADIAKEYDRQGISTVSNVNGSFVVFIFNKRTNDVHVINDRIGSIPVHYAQSESGAILVASEAKALLSFLEVEPTLNYASLVNTLCFGRVKLVRDAMFSGINVQKPGTIMNIRGHVVTHTEYFNYRFKDDRGPEEPAEILEALGGAINRYIGNNEKTCLFLSGGLDSRFLAALIDPRNYQRTIAASFGMKNNNESLIAQSVAALLGMQMVTISLTPADFMNYAESAVMTSEGRDLFVQGYLEKVTGILRLEYDVTAILDGMELGVSLGGDYLHASYGDLQMNELPDFLFKKFYINKAPVEQVFEIDARPIVQECISRAIDETKGIEKAYDKMDYLYIENYTREVMRLRHRIIRKTLHITPLSSSIEYLRNVMSIPGEMKEGRKLQLGLLKAVNSSLLEIPYHSTMLPLNAPAAMWEEGKQIIRRNDEFCARMWRDHRILAPCNHYYTDFAQWLRADKKMVDFSNAVLLSTASILVGSIVKRKWVESILRNHQEGKEDHRSSILYLMSIELWLRTWKSKAESGA